jgi:gliding motility-associated-like protein
MKKVSRHISLFYLAISVSSSSIGQYILNGSATQNSCNCYTLTPAVNTQSGSVWNSNQIDLNTPFDFRFNVNLGCVDANGADGIVFILQPISTSIGSTGEGMGFGGISPSVGITLDTWQNTNLLDPTFDHISIQTNGYITHDGSSNNLTPAAQASTTNPNIEDCQWHVLRITWDPATLWLRAYFDDVLRVEAQKNLVADIFGGDPQVYWGFSAATGGANNLQQFCTILGAGFLTNAANNTVCLGTPVQFIDASLSFTTVQNYYWNFGDGTTSNLQNPPPHYYASPGFYTVQHVITAMDGCTSDTTSLTVTVGAIPVADFTVNDTCFNFIPQVTDQSTCSLGGIGSWTWLLDGSFFSSSPQPNLPILPVGSHTLKLVVASGLGCVSDTVTKTFEIKALPSVDFSTTGGCVNEPVTFSCEQTGPVTPVDMCVWDFGDGTPATQNPVHIFTTIGNYPVQLYAVGSNGCRSPLVQHVVSIGAAPVVQFSVNDTCEGSIPVIINSSTISSGTITQWNWLLNGSSFSTAQNPVLPSTLTAGGYVVQLSATGNTGCASAPVAHDFQIKKRSTISATGANACFGQPVQFDATQMDNATWIVQWNWNFGDAQTSNEQNPSHTYSTAGIFTATVTATASTGCLSQPIQVPVNIIRITVNAGNDTMVISNTPFALDGSASSAGGGSLSYTWTPSSFLNDPNSPRPTATLQNDTMFILTVQSPGGCIARDSVRISVFKGSGIYVPSGFTPNSDGLNDQLKPRYIGIKKLNYFTIYNRWGEKIFSTKDMSKGWDGAYGGKPQNSGAFVWIISAEGLDGQKYQLKGTTIIIR